MLRAAWLALRDLADKSFRRVVWRALLLTLALLVVLGALAQHALAALALFHAAWLNRIVHLLGDLGIILGSVLLAAPVASLFVGIFLDEVALAVERKRYAAEPPGRTLAPLPTLTTALAFLAALLLVNLVALPFYFIPGANFAVYLIANGYILGREYFELVAFRHVSPKEARGLRRANRLSISLVGMIIALALSLPILNLLAPLFGTAFMVHVYKNVEKKRRFAEA